MLLFLTEEIKFYDMYNYGNEQETNFNFKLDRLIMLHSVINAQDLYFKLQLAI